MNDYRYTWIGVFMGVIIYLVTHLFELELFEELIAILHAFEDYEVDEFIIPLIVITGFGWLDQYRRKRTDELEAERAKVYKAMLFSAHHVLNNFLNQIQLFKMRAERTPGFDKKILDIYEKSMNEAKVQIGALSTIDEINDVAIRASVSPEMNTISGEKK